MPTDRSILHLDMDAFFAAVEQRDHPELRGKPVLIGHDGPRGVVATASYEARPYGCHSAQPMSVARRLCPHAIILPVRGERYSEVSEHMFAILDQFSPIVEPLSIDEAFLDLVGTERVLGRPEEVARRLKDRVKSELQLTASVGLAPNKYLAKLASDMNKPDGLTIIWPEDVDRILPPLPITKLWGIGKATAAMLQPLGIRTIDDLRQRPLDWLQQHFGSEAEWYFNLARGIDERPVQTDSEAKGISLKIRFGNFQTINRSMTLGEPTDVTEELWQAARGLFDKWRFQPVRLIGITAERLVEGEVQPGLFPDPERDRQKKLDSVADQINTKFGNSAIRRGGAG